ncbi:response regulator [Paenibacillus sp. LHD-38]|uniref:response regulator n=1 Tax=Paenibacillus sp. LHD-38 TaxID=3072143 RepID=UPI00280D72EC|nr:response regulator [Paenibacillus sp. LHD-38]MDQ8735638.1 response regulator [Paenibacillus sp. LHD-38]
MKKVMLIDDEILIRESIRNCVDWEQEGFIYCGDAPDGEMALPLIEEWMPDILITDIKMPFMNGLELSTIVRQRMPDIKIAILTGHDEFHYAQSALRIGVEDYCLKPVGASDLIEMLHKISRRIDKERQDKKKLTYTSDKLLSDLCGGLISTSDAIETSGNISINLIARYYAVAIIDIRVHESEESLRTEQVEHVLKERMERLITGFSYKRNRSDMIWIIKENDKTAISEAMNIIVNKLRYELQELFNCDLSIGVGSIQDRLQGIHSSFLEADDDKNLQRLSNQNKLAFKDFIKASSISNILLDRNLFVDFMKIGSSVKAEQFVNEFAAELRGLDWQSSMYGCYLLNDITLEAFRVAKQSFTASNHTSDTIQELQQQIREIASWEDCVQYLLILLDRLWLWRSKGSDQYGELIASVKQFINEHYNDDQLSLHVVSKHVGVSPSHLSKVFSQETSQTLTEYLTQSRIRKAMELLKTTRRKTFEIAFEVGYHDQHYFSNIFKKVTGMTPMEFRRQGSTNEKIHVPEDGGK